jgi:hypothetical protein
MKLVCFNRLEKGLRDEAAKVIADPTAPSVERHRAHLVMRDTLNSARERFLRVKARRELGPKPERKNFSTEEEFLATRDAYRDGLDKLASDEVLDNPASPMGKRHLAKRILREIEQRERLRGAVPVARTPRTAPDGPLRPAPVDDVSDDVRKFFSEPATQTTIAPQPEAEKPRPAPQAPQLYCEDHQVSLELCGCSEICPIHLLERRLCRCFKEKK